MSRALFDDEHHAYRESVQAFAARDADDVNAFQGAVEHGFASIAVPENRGGAGIDDRRFDVIVAEELARSGRAGLALVVATHNEAIRHLDDVGADQLVAVALRAADRVPGGLWADAVLLLSGDGLHRLDDQAVINRRPSSLGLGLHDAGFADFDVEESPHERIDAGSLPADLQIVHAVLALAGARHALTETLVYVADRKAFGVPIASFENTRTVLASLSAEIEVAQAYLDTCVLGDRSPARAAAAKLTATAIQARTVDACLQLHGGYGYMTEYAIAQAYTDAWFLRLFGETTAELTGSVAAGLGL